MTELFDEVEAQAHREMSAALDHAYRVTPEGLESLYRKLADDCIRQDGLHEAERREWEQERAVLVNALRRIVADKSGPYRDSMNRCRAIARAALATSQPVAPHPQEIE